MLSILIDADACPVKAEVYRVARRYQMRVRVVANAPLRVPADPLFELVVCPGFVAADDWIAENCGAGDTVITDAIPLARRGTESPRMVEPAPLSSPLTFLWPGEVLPGKRSPSTPRAMLSSNRTPV